MNQYQNHYAQLNFERAGLFEGIRITYRCREVLYPGCAVHITPSLYFPHVIYVDQSPSAAEFFMNETPLMDFVNRHKRYKQSAYIRFIQQDYSQSLPLRDGAFDLLLSLFAGGIVRSCVHYLKPGGLLLTNNHQGDAVDASRDWDLGLKAVVHFRKGKYTITEDVKENNIPAGEQKRNYLREGNRGMAYIENQLYYVFERVR